MPMSLKSSFRQTLLVFLAAVLLSFTIAHLSLCWAFSVLLRTAFVGLLPALWLLVLSSFVAALLLLVVILTVVSGATDITLPAYEAAGAHLIRSRIATDMVRALGDSGIPRTLRSWAKAIRVFAWPILAAWLVLLWVALFRTQLIRYQPVMVVLLWGLVLSVAFAKKKWKLVFIGAIVVFFLFTDVGRVEIPRVAFDSLGLLGGEGAISSREISISGGSSDWTMAFESIPWTNRFAVEFVRGGIRVATASGEIVDNRGLLRGNGVPFLTRDAAHLLDAGIRPDQWLVSDEGAVPFSLVASVVKSGEQPSAGVLTTVRDSILVEAGQSLFLWYNHIVDGRFEGSYLRDRGHYVVRLDPLVTGSIASTPSSQLGSR